jgi:hypothetical protein
MKRGRSSAKLEFIILVNASFNVDASCAQRLGVYDSISSPAGEIAQEIHNSSCYSSVFLHLAVRDLRIQFYSCVHALHDRMRVSRYLLRQAVQATELQQQLAERQYAKRTHILSPELCGMLIFAESEPYLTSNRG